MITLIGFGMMLKKGGTIRGGWLILIMLALLDYKLFEVVGSVLGGCRV